MRMSWDNQADRSRGPRRPGAPQPFLEAPRIAPATQREAAAHGDQARRNPFWRGLRRRRQEPRPTATRRAATLSGNSKYCAQTGAAAHGDQARRNPYWKLQVLRLPHRQEPRPTATRRAATLSGGSKYCACHANRSRGPGAPQPFLEAPSTAPAAQTGAAAHGDQARRNPFWKLQVLRLPRKQEPRPRRAATLSGGSKYCACHTDRSRGPRRPGAPQPFLEAPSTAPATQKGAAAHSDQARHNPFWKLQVLRLPRKQEPRPTATRRAATLSGCSKYCACHTDRSRGQRRPGAPQPFLEAPSTAPATQTATRRAATLSGGSKYCACHANRSRGPGAPQPFLEAPSTAPATQTGAAAHGDQARRNPFWKLQVLRLPHRKEPRPTATRRATTLSGSSKYCACHANRRRGPRRPGAPQPFLDAPSTAPATQTGAAASGDQARRNPF